MDLAALLPWPELRSAVASPVNEELRETADKVASLLATLHRRELGAQGEENGEALTGHAFVDSIRLKNWLDWLEAEDDEYILPERSLEAKAVEAECIRCEYLLWKLNASTPLRYNPFLSHWVEFHKRWAADVVQTQISSLKRQCIRLRLAIVDCALAGQDITVLERLVVPGNSLALVEFVPKPESLDLAPYIRILQEEGIYDPPVEPVRTENVLTGGRNGFSDPDPSSEQSGLAKGKKSVGSKSRSTPPPPEYITISELLAHSPTAVRDVIHRPADLPTLELMNQLISNHAFELANIDTAEVVRQFIQHKLRLLEGAYDESLSNGNGGSSLAAPAPSRDEQQRVVALLILFIRNLIRRGQVAPEEIFFEIQEICTRFIWIREVREFQAFIEGGDSFAPAPVGGPLGG